MTDDELQAYLREAAAVPPLGREEERSPARGASGDPIAEARLVRSQMRLVSIVRTYRGPSVRLSDLVEVGHAGLIEAVRSFDPDAGDKLSMWATCTCGGRSRARAPTRLS